ncbi:hypothetical protein [Amaricoccus tamworthensis]|uniref:hypothetical protein n=1 Tax=Amaricoccus tamworthensis TaxID=57002 RepID=UPI003C7A25AD
MLVLAAAILGALLGWRYANQRGGDRLDKLQYATGFGIAFVLATLVIGTLYLNLTTG